MCVCVCVFVFVSPLQVGYTLSIDLVGLCLDDCSGHGRCDVSGRCVCDAGWLGASCSVDQASITNTTDKVCVCVRICVCVCVSTVCLDW